MKKTIIGLLMVICLAVGLALTPADAAPITTCTTYSGNNVEAQDYERYTSPITSYLTVCADGTLMRVQAGSGIDGVLVEYYDSSYNLQSSKIIAAELPIFGGFYATEENYFLVTGQTNADESAEVEVYRITKYDLSWNRIASVGLYDCNTTIPFDAGSVRMDTYENYLLIRTSHEMYMSDDGKNHQSNVTIMVNMDTMTITDSATKIMNKNYGYISHSFNQFIQVEDKRIVAMDHGDAYPRSLVLQLYNTDLSGGTFYPDYYTKCTLVDVLTFPGATGENVTGASVGGFEISGSSYLIAGNSVVQDEDNLTRTTRNIFVASVDKSTLEVTMNWITDYEEGDGTTSTPQLVKLGDDSYLLLWSRDLSVYYTQLDQTGKQTGSVYSFTGNLSDCVPVVVGEKLIWYTWYNETNTFYEIDLTDLSNQTIEIENGHQYEHLGVTDGYASLKCTVCQEETTIKVATKVPIYWEKSDGSGSYSTAAPDTQWMVGDELGVWITNITPSDANTEMVIEISDPGVIGYVPHSSTVNLGTLKMLKSGTATVTIYPKYNPSLEKTYTFTVAADHYHEYEWSNTVDGVATITCTYCGETTTVTAATSLKVWWNESSGTGSYWSAFTDGKEVGDQLYVWCVSSPDGADSNIEVLIGDSSVVSFTATKTDQSMGYFTMLKPGQTTVTLRSKYNPDAAKTYTITVNGEVETEFKITRATLMLENDITVIFKAPASCGDLYSDIYVTVVQEMADGQTESQNIVGVMSADGEFYEFRYTGVNAKEVGDNLDVTIFGTNAEGALVQGETLEDYSAKLYCMNQLAKTDAELTEMGLSAAKQSVFRSLLVDLLNYGTAAQNYFGYKTDAPANAELTDEQKAYASADSAIENLQSVTNTKQVTITDPSATWKAAGLNLLSKTQIRLKFGYAGDINNVTLTAVVDGVETEITEFVSAGDGLYYAFFDGIAAYQYGSAVDFTLEADGVAISNTLRYSVESYASNNIADAAIGDVVAAMMKYGYSAAAYIAEE